MFVTAARASSSINIPSPHPPHRVACTQLLVQRLLAAAEGRDAASPDPYSDEAYARQEAKWEAKRVRDAARAAAAQAKSEREAAARALADLEDAAAAQARAAAAASAAAAALPPGDKQPRGELPPSGAPAGKRGTRGGK
jgi:colicin import membrane protein